MNGRVLMRSLGDVVAVQPEKRLAGPVFNVFRAACDKGGARFRSHYNAQVAPMKRASAVALALEQAGFQVQLGIGVEANLEEARAAHDVKLTGQLADRIQQVLTRGLEPRSYQLAGIEWLAPRRKAILGDPMGLGKTMQALVAMPERPRAVVVCPASVKGVWRDETRTWRPELFVQILHGRGSFRWPPPGAMVILNYDILPESVQVPHGITLIADECHAVKNPKAQRSERFRPLSAQVLRAGGWSWGLSGTPLWNWPQDLWSVFEAFDLAEDAFGPWKRYIELFEGAWSGSRMVWGAPSAEVPDLIRRVMLRRSREEVLPELPDKTVRDIPVLDLPHDTRKVCDEALEALRRLGINLEEVHDLTVLTKLQGAPFELLAKARHALAIAKLPTMEGLIAEYEAAGEPLVVFSSHRGPVEAAGARRGWAIISGAVGAPRRTEIVSDFQAGKLRGVALTIRAGGVGITLTRSPHVLFVDLDWTPTANSQAEDRVYRIGQTRGVTITRLIADHPIDRHVTRLLTEKQRIISASVEASAVGGAA